MSLAVDKKDVYFFIPVIIILYFSFYSRRKGMYQLIIYSITLFIFYFHSKICCANYFIIRHGQITCFHATSNWLAILNFHWNPTAKAPKIIAAHFFFFFWAYDFTRWESDELFYRSNVIKSSSRTEQPIVESSTVPSYSLKWLVRKWLQQRIMYTIYASMTNRQTRFRSFHDFAYWVRVHLMCDFENECLSRTNSKKGFNFILHKITILPLKWCPHHVII